MNSTESRPPMPFGSMWIILLATSLHPGISQGILSAIVHPQNSKYVLTCIFITNVFYKFLLGLCQHVALAPARLQLLSTNGLEAVYHQPAVALYKILLFQFLAPLHCWV